MNSLSPFPTIFTGGFWNWFQGVGPQIISSFLNPVFQSHVFRSTHLRTSITWWKCKQPPRWSLAPWPLVGTNSKTNFSEKKILETKEIEMLDDTFSRMSTSVCPRSFFDDFFPHQRSRAPWPSSVASGFHPKTREFAKWPLSSHLKIGLLSSKHPFFRCELAASFREKYSSKDYSWIEGIPWVWIGIDVTTIEVPGSSFFKDWNMEVVCLQCDVLITQYIMMYTVM